MFELQARYFPSLEIEMQKYWPPVSRRSTSVYDVVFVKAFASEVQNSIVCHYVNELGVKTVTKISDIPFIKSDSSRWHYLLFICLELEQHSI